MGFTKQDFETVRGVYGLGCAVDFAFETRGQLSNEVVLSNVLRVLGIKERQGVSLGTADVGDEEYVCPDIDVTREFVVGMGHCDGLEVSANILKVALTYDQKFSSIFDIRNEAVKISPRRKARLEEAHKANNTRTNSFFEIPVRDRS